MSAVKCICECYNDNDAKFCKNCGIALKKKYCEKCKSLNHFDAKFCQNCGEDLRSLFVSTVGSLSTVALIKGDGLLESAAMKKIFEEFKNKEGKLDPQAGVEAIKKATSHLVPGGFDMKLMNATMGGEEGIPDADDESQWIEFYEFELIIEQLVKSMKEGCPFSFEEDGEVEEIFNQFDEDVNKHLDLEELIEAVDSLITRFDIPREKVKELFKFYDTNQDNKLDLEEFKGFVKFAIPYITIEKMNEIMKSRRDMYL